MNTHTPPRWPSLLLGLSMFFTGASGLIAEYILGTVSTYILGNSIEQMSITIAVMMFAMGIGSWLQKRLVSERSLVETFVLLEVVLAILIGFAPITLYAAYSTMTIHFALVQYALMGAIGILVGFEIPLVTRINSAYQGVLRVNLSTVITMDYIGAFVGALIWVYVLLQTFPLTESSFIVAGSNLVVALITFGYFWRQRQVRYPKALSMAVMMVIVAVSLGYTYNRDWSALLEQRLYDDPIAYAETTKYQRIVLTHYDQKQLNEYRLYINGNLQFSSVDEHIYHEQLVHPAMTLTPQHKRVLVLGGGDGLPIREIKKYDGVESITVVDLDPGMVEFASTHPVMKRLNSNAFSDARVHTSFPIGEDSGYDRSVVQEVKWRKNQNPKVQQVASVDVIHIDADRFLDWATGVWDVVIIDFPDPNSVELAKLYSKQFYQKLRCHVRPGGKVVVQASSPYHAEKSYQCVLRTIRAAGFNAIPYHDNVPSFGEWGWIMAWQGTLDTETVKDQIENISSFPVETEYLTPAVFRSALVFGKDRLDADVRVNTLMRPVLVKYYLNESWYIE